MRHYWSTETRKMVAGWSPEEREKWISKVNEEDKVSELFTFAGGRMNPKQIHAWANLAAEFPGATIGNNSIYRPADEDEILLMAADKADWAKRYGHEDDDE